MTDTKVLVGIPTYDAGAHINLMASLLNEMSAPGSPPFRVATHISSLLAFTCNALWVTALNNRAEFTHFLMIHADVLPNEPGFIGKMLAEMEAQHCDVLSVVLPIKDDKGLASTAFVPDARYAGLKTDPVRRRRLTLREVDGLPETFGVGDVAELFDVGYAPDPCLLVNTGLMLVSMTGKWVEKVRFQINDVVYRKPDGQFDVDVEPEDWFFSRMAYLAGARVFATRAVKARHAGRAQFPNWGAWGRLEHDLPEGNHAGGNHAGLPEGNHAGLPQQEEPNETVLQERLRQHSLEAAL